jgi:hypothetical protein
LDPCSELDGEVGAEVDPAECVELPDPLWEPPSFELVPQLAARKADAAQSTTLGK